MDNQLPLFSEPTPAEGKAEHPAPAPAPALGPDASFTAAIFAWREHLEREHSPVNTVKAFVGDMNLAAQFIGAYKSVGQIATRDLNNWLQWQRTHQKFSPKTYARRVTSLKAFFRWLASTGALATDPAAALIQQSVISPLPVVLSDSEVEAALAAAAGLRQGEDANPTPLVLFSLLLRTGIKKGECLALETNHVDVSDPSQPVLWVRHRDPLHRYKERKLRLDPAWLPWYHGYLDHRARYLARHAPESKAAQRADQLFPWSPRRLEYWLQDIGQAAGLTKQISFDMCRWTCAQRDSRAGMDDNHIRQKLGLSKIQWREIGMKLRRLSEAPL